MSAASLLTFARNELGQGCPGRPNKYTRWYGTNGAWCAMFASYCAAHSGNGGVIPKHSYTPTGAAWFKARGQWITRFEDLRPGDIAYWNFNCGRICHVGIVETSPSGGGAYFIEGNTSSASQANGGCVQRKWRTKTYFAGAGRPAYGSTSNPVQKDWLEKDDSGAAVTELQKQLVAAGFSVGPYGTDGVYGDDVYLAVVAYQVSRGLEPDGVAGPITRQALATGRAPVARNADGSLTLAEDGARGGATIGRWQEVMGTPVDFKISVPSSLIKADQKFLNSVVATEHIRNLTGKPQLEEDGKEGPMTNKVRQFYLFNLLAWAVLGRAPRNSDFDGIMGSTSNKLHQRALNKATAGSGRY